ncbi:phage integrase [Bergeriella denitrificans]|uniref:Phage integrase n=1 Tax=Bergeriella denitrificans TaxID=494 RepID=A0A378UFH7_BERDE|nr:phage integrase [Bergeriella denitrificans]
MNPALNERLTAVAAHADTLGRGGKSAYLKRQAAELGMSLATLYRKLEAVSVKPGRKRAQRRG